MARPRNNISKLPADIRCIISEMLFDAMEYEEIRNAPIVKQACEKKGYQLSNGAFAKYMTGKEHKMYCRIRMEWQVILTKEADIERTKHANG